MPESPASQRILRASVLLFGAWTVLCQVVVLAGGNTWHLLSASVAAALVGWVLARRRRHSRGEASDLAAEPAAGAARLESDSLRTPLLALPGSAVAAGILARGGDIHLFWAVAVAQLALAWMWTLRRGGEESAPAASRSLERGLWVLALASVVITLIAHRPSMDDAFYVNVALHVAQDPSAPLLRFDTMFGLEGMPIQLPIYRLHSIEVLAGVVSLVTRLPAILAMHWVVAGSSALLLPLAHAALFRELVPRRWLLATCLSCLTLLAWGGERIAYGNFAFVHLFQGKAIFAAVWVPLLVAVALRWSREPTRLNFLVLLAAQIGAVGLTWIALALGPVVVGLTLLGSWRPTRAATRTLLIGLLPSLYSIGAGWVTRSQVRQRPVNWEAVTDPSAFMADTLEKVIGGGGFLWLVSFLLLWAWSVAPPSTARRVLVVLPLGFLLTLFNPWLVKWIARELGNLSVYARVFWALPLPILVTVGLTAPDRVWGSRRPHWAGVAFSVIVAAGLLLSLGPDHTLSSANDTRLGWPGPKTPPVEYELARMLVEEAGPDGVVLAPSEVAAWVTTFERHPQPIYSRHNYDPYLRWFVGQQDANQRRNLVRAAEGKQLLMIPQLRRGVEDYGLTAVCTHRLDPRRAQGIMSRGGFVRVGGIDEYEVWVRRGALPAGKKGRAPTGSG